MSKELIDVRPDERFDEQKLMEFLEGKIDGIDPENYNVKQFGGGAANLTYELNFPDNTYVLRRPPLGRIAKSAHDMSREYKVLSVLYQEFPYAPQAYYYCEDTDIIGSDFFVMERKYGTVVRRSVPEVFEGMSNFGEKASKSLIDTLVKFHQVDYDKIGLADLGKPNGFVERQIEGWYRRWNGAKVTDNEDMDILYEWLKHNVPDEYPHSIVHNDYKLDNVMLENSDPSKIVAVFDWDMATLGTPLSDLGSVLTYWVQHDDPAYLKGAAMMPTDDLGFLTREQLVARYAQKSGRSVDDINFYHTLGLFRLVVIIAQIFYRYYHGQTQDKRFASFGQMIPLFAKNAIQVMKQH